MRCDLCNSYPHTEGCPNGTHYENEDETTLRCDDCSRRIKNEKYYHINDYILCTTCIEDYLIEND